MAAGRLHIFELGAERDRYGGALHEYQVNYNDAGNTFTGVLDEEKLKEFLRQTGVTPDGMDGVLKELHTAGRTTLEDIKIPENETGALGLVQEPSDA